MTYQELLRKAEKRIKKVGLEVDVAKFLLMHYANLEVHDLYMKLEDNIEDEMIISAFESGLALYIDDKVPLQYITGIQPFYGYDFKVGRGVFIPRWETEELVERLIIHIDTYYEGESFKIVDLGTGSGCISVTLAKEVENSKVFATEISEDAYKIAQNNNERLNANVTILKGSLFEPLKNEKFNVIVSNPPYIPDGEAVGITVVHEPSVALYGGVEGLDFYERIISEARNHILPGGLIAFEHAYNKNDELRAIAKKYFPNATINQYKDASGRDRFTFIEVGEYHV